MGRLIDTDAIKWDICEDADGNPVYVLDKRDIDKQPTAYDVDAVVEQLEKLKEECEDPLQDYDPNYFINKAIEIAKGGGVDE